MLDTPYRSCYIKEGFNDDRNAIAAFGVTHLLLRPNDLTGAMVTQHFPDAMQTAKPAGKAEVRTTTLTLFELAKPLR